MRYKLLAINNSTPIKLISEELSINHKGAKQIKESCLHAYSPNDVDKALDQAMILMEGFGIESVRTVNGIWTVYYMDTKGIYVNMGDTYVNTLIYDIENHKFYITCLGDYIEEIEKHGIEVK